MDDEPQDDPPINLESIRRLEKALSDLIDYHISEYNMPCATVIGVLHCEAFSRLHTPAQHEDEDDVDT